MLLSAQQYEGKQPYAFISYCRKNLDLCRNLLQSLTDGQIRFWYDNQIRPGEDWINVISEHLAGCHVCIAIITKESIDSYNCSKELSFAKLKKIPVIPIIVGDVAMSTPMEFMFMGCQHIHIKSDAQWAENKILEAATVKECFDSSLPIVKVTDDSKEELGPETEEEVSAQPVDPGKKVSEVSPRQARELLVLNPQTGTMQRFAGGRPILLINGEAAIDGQTPAEEDLALHAEEDRNSLTVQNVGKAAVYADYLPLKPQQQFSLDTGVTITDGARELILCTGKTAENLKKAGKICRLTCEENREHKYILDQDVSIGRGNVWAKGTMDDPLVENRQFRLYLEAGTFFVEDLESGNGTLLNCEFLEPGHPRQLKDGDRIQAGTTVLTFRQFPAQQKN